MIFDEVADTPRLWFAARVEKVGGLYEPVVLVYEEGNEYHLGGKQGLLQPSYAVAFRMAWDEAQALAVLELDSYEEQVFAYGDPDRTN